MKDIKLGQDKIIEEPDPSRKQWQKALRLLQEMADVADPPVEGTKYYTLFQQVRSKVYGFLEEVSDGEEYCPYCRQRIKG